MMREFIELLEMYEVQRAQLRRSIAQTAEAIALGNRAASAWETAKRECVALRAENTRLQAKLNSLGRMGI